MLYGASNLYTEMMIDDGVGGDITIHEGRFHAVVIEGVEWLFIYRDTHCRNRK